MANTNNVQKYLKLVVYMTLYTNNMRKAMSSTNCYVIISCDAKCHAQVSGNSKRERGHPPESSYNSNS
jgi:hypothetical protein